MLLCIRGQFYLLNHNGTEAVDTLISKQRNENINDAIGKRWPRQTAAKTLSAAIKESVGYLIQRFENENN